MNHAPRLSALIVNYDTGSYAVCCVESLLVEWEREGRAREDLEIVCVDNASPEDQEPWLRELEELGAKVVRADENLGYARGMNLAYEHTTGGPKDVVAILNPDLHFLPGSVGALCDYVLDHPDCGAVDPLACIDPLGALNLPRNLLPTPIEHWRVTLAQLSPFLCRLYSKRRFRLSLPWWTSPEPIETDMLSGCCVFLRREVVERMGRPMDPRYPLYFEDTDLFRTLGEMGLTVVHHTGAKILHHWSRSAKVGGAFADEPTRRHEISRTAYYDKFYGPLGRFMVRAVNKLSAWWPKEKVGRPMMPLEDLGAFTDPVELPLPRRCRYLIEIAINPTFIICAGSLGEGDRWVCPPEAWEWLFRLEYYARAIDLDSGRVLAGWRFTKATDCRAEAMHSDELAALGDRILAGAPA